MKSKLIFRYWVLQLFMRYWTCTRHWVTCWLYQDRDELISTLTKSLVKEIKIQTVYSELKTFLSYPTTRKKGKKESAKPFFILLPPDLPVPQRQYPGSLCLHTDSVDSLPMFYMGRLLSRTGSHCCLLENFSKATIFSLFLLITSSSLPLFCIVDIIRKAHYTYPS